ncbi:CLUMA_CG006493, isoform A [Clunio marinus]|uniref:CLUMA_CG006493, isoform A n=1 Tax=Clunio marinus TaxID=568069 RepID=A0A1J1I3T9_9DIPT|nr:CLUMA_CG006493, isoform A [Clunio marinus]
MNLYKLIYFILAVIFAKCKSTLKAASASPTMVVSKYPSPVNTCGGILTDKYGTIQTPNFPNPFNVPISCVWILDASSFWGTPNTSIFIYLTQQYVLSGLTFKEYMYYSDDFKVPTEKETIVKEENVTRTVSVQSNSPFVEIKFELDNLYGTQLRVMDHLLDVYGFNITYEVGTPKSYQCNSMRCSFLGSCYATKDYS